MRARSSVWLYERSLKVLQGRDGANDFRQPSDNFDEEHHTFVRERVSSFLRPPEEPDRTSGSSP
jgi:hypothetical protein